MDANQIRKEVQKGLAIAASIAGGSGAPLVYHIKTTKTGGSPIAEPTVTTEEILLPNAVFTKIKTSLIDGTLIKKGDMSLSADYNAVLEVGDTIRQGDRQFIVVTTDPVAPFGTSLARKCVVRAQ